jgi:hypothetical protein
MTLLELAERVEGDVALFPKAEATLRAIGKWGYPDRALHWTHRRFFHRHGLIEIHSPGRVRTTAKADAVLTRHAMEGLS